MPGDDIALATERDIMTIRTTTQTSATSTGDVRRSVVGHSSVLASTMIKVLAIAALVPAGLGIAAVARADDVEGGEGVEGGDVIELEYDIAEDGTRFVFDNPPVFDDGVPAFGNGFVTGGYIYESGAIESVGAGVNADGTPTHPELVIGEWTRRGHVIGDDALSDTSVWTATTQTFDTGARQITTEGLELIDHEVAGRRVIVGATGEFRRATGEQTQVHHGRNGSDGVQLTVELSLEMPTS